MRRSGEREQKWKISVQGNLDPYGKAVLDYAERWANLMEATCEREHVTISDCAERTSRDADTEGITGFMYGAAVATLAECWDDGEELRQWHNAQYLLAGQQDTGGTINPAIISVG